VVLEKDGEDQLDRPMKKYYKGSRRKIMSYIKYKKEI
jgi:hypothetical protein